MAKLTNKKHIQFCNEYLQNGLNATQAYLSVYKNVKKKATAEVNGSKLLSNAKVKAYIEEEQAKTAKKLEVTREDIVNEYLQLIKSAKDEGMDGGGTIKDRTNWAKALSQLSKLLGLDEPEKQEVTLKSEQPLFGPVDKDNKND